MLLIHLSIDSETHRELATEHAVKGEKGAYTDGVGPCLLSNHNVY